MGETWRAVSVCVGVWCAWCVCVCMCVCLFVRIHTVQSRLIEVSLFPFREEGSV